MRWYSMRWDSMWCGAVRCGVMYVCMYVCMCPVRRVDASSVCVCVHVCLLRLAVRLSCAHTHVEIEIQRVPEWAIGRTDPLDPFDTNKCLCVRMECVSYVWCAWHVRLVCLGFSDVRAMDASRHRTYIASV